MADNQVPLVWCCLLLTCLIVGTEQRQPNTQTQVCQAQADICFLIDSSESTQDNNPAGNWRSLLSFVESVVDAFDVGRTKTRFGAVTFGKTTELMFNLRKYFSKIQIKRAIRGSKYIGGGSDMSGGLRKLRTDCFGGPRTGNRLDVQDIAMVITKSRPTINDNLWETQAQNMKLSDTYVIAIGVTDVIDDEFLGQISSLPQLRDLNYFHSANYEELAKIVQPLVNQTCELL